MMPIKSCLNKVPLYARRKTRETLEWQGKTPLSPGVRDADGSMRLCLGVMLAVETIKGLPGEGDGSAQKLTDAALAGDMSLVYNTLADWGISAPEVEVFLDFNDRASSDETERTAILVALLDEVLPEVTIPA